MRKSARNRDGKGQQPAGEDKSVSLGRHEYHSTVCTHPQREEIEQEWIGWGSTSRIAKHYDVSRDSL